MWALFSGQELSLQCQYQCIVWRTRTVFTVAEATLCSSCRITESTGHFVSYSAHVTTDNDTVDAKSPIFFLPKLAHFSRGISCFI
jgi:hypothetical protein